MAVMHPGLWLLFTLRVRSGLRKSFRGLRNPRRAIFLLMGLAVVALWLVPVFFSLPGDGRRSPDTANTGLPLLIVALCFFSLISSANERAIYFSPSEINFLFSGPFGSRELLAYKILVSLIGIAFSSLIFSFVFRSYARYWLFGFVGVFLIFSFIHFFSMLFALLRDSVSEGAFRHVRRAALLVLGVALAVGLVMTAQAMRSENMSEGFAAVQRSALFRAVQLPLVPFARTVTSPALGEFAIWASTALAIVLAMGAAVLSLNAEFRDSALETSQRITARLQSARRGNWMASAKASGRARCPRLPYFGGVGPTVWRQATSALRSLRSLITIFVLSGAWMAVFLVFSLRDADNAYVVLVPGLMWLSILATGTFRFDFRGDVDRMETLKALPVRPSALVLGQLVTPVLMTTGLQVALAAAIVAMSAPSFLLFVPLAALALLPLNVLMFAVENAFFLVFPMRAVAVAPGDFQVFGRQALVLFFKFTAILFGAGVAAVPGVLLYFVTESYVLSGLAAWLVLCAEAAAVIPAVTRAYSRFDVALEASEE